MTAREAGHRAREKFRIQSDRTRTFLRPSGPSHCNVPSEYLTRDYLAGEPSRRFFVPVSRQDSLRKIAQLDFPYWIAQTVLAADRICNHHLSVLGHREVRLGGVVDWCADPISGTPWRQRFWADYDPVHRCEGGDVKVVHEINRHQHLITLARAYMYTGNERYATEAIEQLEQWIEQNPVGIGINWHSSLEISIRAISWLWVVFLLLPGEQLDARSSERIMKSLLAHFAHVYRYPSVYSSPNTHLIGEAAALYIGGTVFSAIREGRRWRELGEALLIREADRQVLEDGIYGELSSCYHCYALEFYLLAIAMAQRTHREFPPSVLHRVESMLEALVRLSRPNGSIPLLSDDDGGRAMGLSSGSYGDIRDLMSTGAVLFGNSEAKWCAQRFHEETMLLTGADGYAAFERLEPRPPTHQSRMFADSGLFVARSGWNENDDQIIFDCGGLGMLGGGHGHADALSVVLSVGSRELLVDPGTGVYNGKPEWRNYFRSTRAHNTVVIDDEDQAEAADTFRWKDDYSVGIVRHLALPDANYVEAEHDAFMRLDQPVMHRRRLLRAGPQCWVIADDFRGDGQHRFDTCFHFAPDAKISVDPRSSLTCAGIQSRTGDIGLGLAFFASNAVQADVVCGSEQPIQGWHSNRYGDMRPAPALCLTVNDLVPSAAITVLIPTTAIEREDAPVLKELLVEGAPGAACVVEHRGMQDVFAMALRDVPIRVAQFQLHGEFFWIRSLDGRVCELFCTNTRYVAIEEEVLFENPDAVSCVSVRFSRDRITTLYSGERKDIYVRH